MWKAHRVAVVVPAYNEADKIARSVRSVPGFVDHVLVVDDGSHDGTGRVAGRSQRRGLEVLRHVENRGVGAAIATGYGRARALDADVICVMAGDSQMDPADLRELVEAVTAQGVDYAKGNRFMGGTAARTMPWVRFVGNVALSWLTRLALGRRDLFDSQCGYTACNKRALRTILSRPVFPRYGYPNALLLQLSAAGLAIRDVPVRPVYGPAWRSGIRPWKVVLPIAGLLVRGWCARAVRALRWPTARIREHRLLAK